MRSFWQLLQTWKHASHEPHETLVEKCWSVIIIVLIIVVIIIVVAIIVVVVVA